MPLNTVDKYSFIIIQVRISQNTTTLLRLFVYLRGLITKLGYANHSNMISNTIMSEMVC